LSSGWFAAAAAGEVGGEEIGAGAGNRNTVIVPPVVPTLRRGKISTPAASMMRARHVGIR
jgi:hypothetical protein